MTDIASLSAADLVRLFRKRELSPVEATADALARIDRFEPAVNAFLLVDREGALASARESEARWARGEARSLLDGVPATIKDNIWTKDWPSRRGSRTTPDTPAPDDAPAVARLREAGTPILGKTTVPEFMWTGACHSPLTGITRNPWDLSRTPGGSSGGAGAAAALNLGWLHLGTDAAGSIRIPAAFSGVFGLKPHYGRVPAYPVSVAQNVAHQGPLTRTVTDAARMLSIISRPDMRDMGAFNTPPPDFEIGLNDGVKRLRIAWAPRLGGYTGVDPEIAAATAAAVKVFEDLGARVEEADPGLPPSADLVRAVWVAALGFMIDAVPEAERAVMDQDLLRFAMAWRPTLGDFFTAQDKRMELVQVMNAFHARYDLLLTPQTPVAALEVGLAAPAGSPQGDTLLDWSPFTFPFNITQQPAASVPCGFTSAGLPIGLQIVGPPRAEALVLRAARAFESARPFATISEPRGAV